MWDRGGLDRSRRAPVGTGRAPAGFFPVMTNERKIWEAALMLVRRHGAEAPKIAEREASRLRNGGDELTCVVWCWIALTATELLRPVPQKDESVH
jgi:hypothetical protein